MPDYIENIQIGDNAPVNLLTGDNFAGRWVGKHWTFENAYVQTANTYVDFDLSDYLPNDNYDYEIMLSHICNTPDTANTASYYWVYSGKQHTFSCRLNGVANRTAAHENAAGVAIIPIKANDRYFSIYLETGCISGACYGDVIGYRRLGKNTIKDNSMSGFTFTNGTLPFGGLSIDGKWVSKRVELWANVVLEASQANTITVDLSNCVPNDGHDYMCIIDGTSITSNVTGTYLSTRVKLPTWDTWICLMEQVCRSGATKTTYFNMMIPIFAQNKTLQFRNYGNTVSTNNLRFCAYRRLGTNV